MIDVYFIGGPANGKRMQMDETKMTTTFYVPVHPSISYTVGPEPVKVEAFGRAKYTLHAVRDPDQHRRWVAVSDFGLLENLIREGLCTLEH